MTLLPEVREQLLDAAFGAAEPTPGALRDRRLGHLAIAGLTVVSLVVAAIFLVNLHGPRTPPSGPAAPPSGPAAQPSAPPPHAWVNALGRAGETVRKRDPACRLTGGRPPATTGPTQVRVGNQRFLTTAPPRSITSVLPSLASPAPSALRVTVRELRALHVDANGIYARYAWQGRTEGVHYYVIPAAAVGTTELVPVRCYQEALTAFRKEARHLPAGQRAAAISYAQQRFAPGAEAGVSIVTVGWGLRSEDNPQAWMLAELKTHPASGGGGAGSNNSTTTELLVTDQVASVTATYPAQNYPGRVPKTFSVTKRPIRNLVIIHLAGAWDPPRLTFRSATGAVISQTHKR